MKEDSLPDILLHWGIELKKVRDDIVFYGSPKRSLERYAVDDILGNTYILEKIFMHERTHKEKVAQIVEYFHNQELPVAPYLKNNVGKHIVEYRGTFWQLSPFIKGISLNRTTYPCDAWRGEKMAQFLKDLSQKNTGMSRLNLDMPVFSLKQHIPLFAHQVTRHNPEIQERLRPILTFLGQNFFDVYDDLPTAFCHGDFHVMNIVWGEKNINAVIDWEFFGYKSEMYDSAIAVGCIGIEHPNYLSDPMSLTFIRELRACNIYKDESWKYFLELVITVRLGWLEYWLRIKDADLVDLELDYLNLLIKEQEYFRKIWGI